MGQLCFWGPGTSLTLHKHSLSSLKDPPTPCMLIKDWKQEFIVQKKQHSQNNISLKGTFCHRSPSRHKTQKVLDSDNQVFSFLGEVSLKMK